jgi:hydroxyacylglutathione hydrolase
MRKVLLLLTLACLQGCMHIPSAQAPRVGDANIRGIDADGSMAWVVATETGVVLIDAGWDPKAVALKKEVGERQVHAILLTHGHFDHTAAIRAFPDAPVIVGPGESGLVRTGDADLGWMATMSGWFMAPSQYVPRNLREFVDGEVLEIDGALFLALHAPGHTKGSAMYLHDDVLFTGDSIVGEKGAMYRLPSGTYTSVALVRGSVRKVMDYCFRRVADGHAGIHENARAQVAAFLKR